MQRLLSITLITIAADHVLAQDGDMEHQGPQTCGGRLKGPVGTITTPNFPNPFPVPIKCKWIIEHDIVNGTISIYFTQQYTTSGLTFTEYMYYDDTYKLGERRALTVTEENITRIKWLQVQSPVLVVELDLNRLEGTQLRALGLLSVFGFNVTYEVRGPAQSPGPTSCSAIECRLLGHCYARKDYQEFYCACFDGYSGPDCGVGPLCPQTSNMCKNGGTCRQMGPAAVSCICAPGFTGDLCESQIATPGKEVTDGTRCIPISIILKTECGVEECGESCKNEAGCDCNPKDTDFLAARFETRLQVVDQPSINISEEIIKELTGYLKSSNITLEDNIEFLNTSSLEDGGVRTVWVRIWAARRDAGALRAALARLAATRARTNHLQFLPATLQIDMHPALSLHTLVVNQRPEIWEGSEFILTCMAYGSPKIAFTWYKDGIRINFNGTTRDIWTRTVNEDALGRRMSVLGVSEAKKPDSGKWSCAADDAGRRRCRALRLSVLRPPEIRLVPSALTVNKGDNVSITCLAGASRVHGALGFSWARERTLLRLAPGREVWEDLFPAGSVLKLYNVQKSSEFQCQVSSMAGTNAKALTMWALGSNDEACPSDASYGLRWPKTAPGAHASAACPPGYTGETTRFCEPKTGQHGVKWMLPDFSHCVADSLRDIYEQFVRISFGYSWEEVWTVCRQYGAALRSLAALPGAGDPPLTHAHHILHYLMSPAATPSDRHHSAEHLLNMSDHLLKHPDAFLDEAVSKARGQKINVLQNVIADTASMRNNFEKQYQEFTVNTKSFKDNAAHFVFQTVPLRVEEWVLTSVGVELMSNTNNASVVTVLYHNLGARLPSLRRSIEFNCSGNSSRLGHETEYAIASQQVQVSVTGRGVDAAPQMVTLLFMHSKNYSVVASKLACGLRTASEPRTWRTQVCEVRIPEPSFVACRCRGLGTFALFTIARSTLTDAEEDLRGVVRITVTLGAAMCLIAALLQLLALVSDRKIKLLVLLKAVTAGTHCAAMLALLECDRGQEVACGGPVGWICTICWCTACAALCAQPLLLHAELAGRATKVPSVGLLAGVCMLSWLTARLWGGAPLQLGAAAAAVCGAGAALLTALTLALTLCAARTLRAVSHKLPADRRRYVHSHRRVIRHTVVLVLSTSAAQAAGVAYAQPADTTQLHRVALCIAALANGIAMLVCYVICDEPCLLGIRRLFKIYSNKDWQDSAAGDTSLSLYIKQGGEAESRGGVNNLESSSSPGSPASYWRAPRLEGPVRMHRRQSDGDCRADIVRCVEYKEVIPSPQRRDTHAVCDLIPTGTVTAAVNGVHPHTYMSRVCVETRQHPAPAPAHVPHYTCIQHPQPYSENTFDLDMKNCTICVQSNPDVSKIPPPVIKSCLKKSASQFPSSSSLPPIQHSAECRRDIPTHIQHVNRTWNDAYDISVPTDKVLNKISNDLDFLLNRTQTCPEHIEEAPT